MDCDCDNNALRRFVGDTLTLALEGKKKERLRAVQALGAVALALSFNARVKVYVGQIVAGTWDPDDEPDEPDTVHEDEPEPMTMCASDPAYARSTDDHPSCVINEDAHGH